jgi:hypothetical protein
MANEDQVIGLTDAIGRTPSKSSQRRAAWWRRKRVLPLALAIGAVVFFFGQASSLSVCGTCGEERRTTELVIPFTTIAYLCWHHDTPTLLSQVVERDHLELAKHQWIMFSYNKPVSAGGVGHGRYMLASSSWPEVANFVDAVAKYQGSDAANRWLKVVLNPDGPSYAAMFLQATAPKDGFRSSDEFFRWLRDNADDISQLQSPSNH